MIETPAIFSINDAVNQITQQLADISTTPRLDAELLATAVLDRSRAWLFAHPEQLFTPEQENLLKNLAERRAAGEPMAYILGHKEFWGIKLSVTPDVLIPRPETEHIIEWILSQYSEIYPLSLADLGTGSGAIALAVALERTLWKIDATDVSLAALKIAEKNAAQHGAQNINFFLGNWCAALPLQKYGLIISNPPYIAENDPHLNQLTYEPQTALRSGPDGLDAIRAIAAEAPYYLKSPGYLILEHGHDQARAVTKILREKGFKDIQTHRDLANHPRFTTARHLS